MYVKFNWVELSNFMSFGAATQRITLNNDSLNVIIGDNLDNGKEHESKNGAGKSTILQGVLFALYGDGFADMKLDEFVNLKNGKKLCASVSFTVDNDEYIVTRKRKPASIALTKNGEPFTLSSSKNEDADIIELIGYDSDVFMNTSMLTNNIDNFIYLKSAAQKAFIEKMFNINILTHRSNSLKVANKNISADITSEIATITANKANNTRLENMMANLVQQSSTWADNKTTQISDHTAKLDRLLQVDTDTHRSINTQIDALRMKSKDSVMRVETLGSKIKTEIPKLAKLKSELDKLRAGKCPRCDQSWTSEEDILSTESSIDMIDKSLEEIKQPLQDALSIESDTKTHLERILSENVNNLNEGQIAEIERSIINANEAITRLQAESVNPYQNQISEMVDNKADVDDTKLKQLNTLGDHYKFMIKLLTDSKSFIRKAIINQYVPIINKYVNDYLILLESPHIFTMNDDLSMDVKYMGKNVSVGMLSTGEKIRMSFALSMAFRNFNSLTGHSSNILFIDEILDSGTDASGYHSIIDILKKVDLTVFVISHQEMVKTEADNIITVRKENGFSTVVWNE